MQDKHPQFLRLVASFQSKVDYCIVEPENAEWWGVYTDALTELLLVRYSLTTQPPQLFFLGTCTSSYCRVLNG